MKELDHSEGKEALWPISHYLQRRATPEKRNEIAEQIVKNCPELVDLLCEGILHPFVVGKVISQHKSSLLVD